MDAAQRELVSTHLALVDAIAGQVIREVGVPTSARDDLVSAGREGLVAAAARFDATRGVPFRLFGSHRIRGAMLDWLRREASLPRRAYDRLRALSGALDLNEAAAEQLAAPAAPGTTTAALDARLAEHLANLATAMATGFVAQTTIDEGEVTALDPAPLAEETLSRHQLSVRVRAAVSQLPDQERALVERHYFGGERFDLVASDLGLSKSWASRLHTRAIGRLTAELAGA
jgi:RNA polymerase sigma factor for flagellar operon FliA